MSYLFEDLLPRVRNLVRYLVRGDAQVDDLSQEALLAILRGIGGYAGSGEFKAWADRVTARCVFRHLKRERHASPDELEVIAASDAQSPQGESYAIRRQAVERLDRLPHEQRVALVLRYVVGLSVKEVAEEVGVGEETVRSRLRLGKERLRQSLRSKPPKLVGIG